VPVASFLLPAASRFGAQRLPAPTASAIGRADHARARDGRRAQLMRHVAPGGGGWPIAALSRQADAGDAAGAAWLRADPAYLRPELSGVRLMAHGDTLAVDQDDVAAFLPALKPVFGDAGFLLDAPVPSRWYLRLPAGTPLPGFPDPGEALGADLAEHLDDDGAAARRWRMLASESQIVLHNHPWNARRAASGRVPVNALWFWGGGSLPAARSPRAQPAPVVFTDDATTHALAAFAATARALAERYAPADGPTIHDLAALRDLARLDRDWLQPALGALRQGRIQALVLDAEDGNVATLRRWHRLRVWRKPMPGLRP
jgi:hypothetical protein